MFYRKVSETKPVLQTPSWVRLQVLTKLETQVKRVEPPLARLSNNPQIQRLSWFPGFLTNTVQYSKFFRPAELISQTALPWSDLSELTFMIWPLWSDLSDLTSLIWPLWSDLSDLTSLIWPLWSDLSDVTSQIWSRGLLNFVIVDPDLSMTLTSYVTWPFYGLDLVCDLTFCMTLTTCDLTYLWPWPRVTWTFYDLDLVCDRDPFYDLDLVWLWLFLLPLTSCVTWPLGWLRHSVPSCRIRPVRRSVVHPPYTCHSASFTESTILVLLETRVGISLLRYRSFHFFEHMSD